VVTSEKQKLFHIRLFAYTVLFIMASSCHIGHPSDALLALHIYS
jgi:hypothetical protein